MARSPTTHARTAVPLDFSRYVFSDLVEIKQALQDEIQSRKDQELAALRSQMTESARMLGVSVEELVGVSKRGTRQTRHPRGPQPPKYRGPNGEEWSGRGPSPRWMKPLLAKGKTKADFLIKSS